MSKKTYYVAAGVEIVNRAPVPKNRRVRLTESEAIYDLALGRISARKPAVTKKGAADKGED
ncbi:hypothetical protein [Labrenzia sp. DG1229]|uniref:hypothetical protein n=1 Tax=Labrenzia sp. DG1229 TaxID=681847 RepID=UPI00048EE174|nr:hypothetical protein [Labrenzia sp. DG1229]